MTLRTPIAFLIGAAGLTFISALSNSFELLFLAATAGGVGIGTLFPALKARWTAGHVAPDSKQQIAALEERLRLAESELADATRQIAVLSEKRDFDAQLGAPTRSLER